MVRGTRIAMVLGAVVLLASACGTDGKTPFSPEVKPASNGLTLGGNVTGGGGSGTQSTTSSSTTSGTTAPGDTTLTVDRGLPTGGN
jgi:hypothetical protein